MYIFEPISTNRNDCLDENKTFCFYQVWNTNSPSFLECVVLYNMYNPPEAHSSKNIFVHWYCAEREITSTQLFYFPQDIGPQLFNAIQLSKNLDLMHKHNAS